jgi:hypothetical protein
MIDPHALQAMVILPSYLLQYLRSSLFLQNFPTRIVVWIRKWTSPKPLDLRKNNHSTSHLIQRCIPCSSNDFFKNKSATSYIKTNSYYSLILCVSTKLRLRAEEGSSGRQCKMIQRVWVSRYGSKRFVTYLQVAELSTVYCYFIKL